MKDDMKVTDIIKDIGRDYDNEHARSFYNQSDYMLNTRGRNSFDYAAWKLLMPNIFGFLLGCALLKLLGGGGWGYLVMGCIGSVVMGMFDNMIMRKMDLRSALIRNIILFLIVAVPTAAVAIFFTLSER